MSHTVGELLGLVKDGEHYALKKTLSKSSWGNLFRYTPVSVQNLDGVAVEDGDGTICSAGILQ